MTALLLSISFFTLVYGFVHQNRIAFGLRFDGRPITGLTQQEAMQLFEAKAQALIPEPAIILNDGDKSYPIPAASIGLKADTEKALKEAYGAGRTGNDLQCLFDALDCALLGRTIELTGTWDEDKLDAELKKTAAAIDRPPVEGLVWIDAKGIQHRPAQEGRKLDTAAVKNALVPKLKELRLPQTAELPVEVTPPAIANDMYTSVNSVLAEYSTAYIANSNRGENIEIAAEKLNHHILLPGQEFSFNGTVGSRVLSEGYLDAPVIVDGKVEQDIGGGVCQVSSTLYNAILLAGLTPTVRTSHFYPSSYVPAGLDATVADGQIDFCFRNDLPHSVYILAGASGGTLTVAILGAAEDTVDYGLTTEITGSNPTVDVYRLTYENGAVVNSEFLHTDDYDIPPADSGH